ncbi:MAG: DUF6701 domain-containing protein [Cellvibrionaceae bacterium]
MIKLSWAFSFFVLLALSGVVTAAPGDILFEEYFNSNGDLSADWNRSSTSDVGTSTATFDSPPQAAFLRDGPDSLTLKSSRSIDAAVPAATLNVWVRRGADSFSEDPDTGENLTVEYSDNSGSWFVLETFTGSGTPGEIFDRSYELPAAALHDALRLRFQNANSDNNVDYWHIDDVVVIESGPPVPPTAIAEWYLDETLWLGAVNEVQDEGPNGLHGRAINVGGLPGTEIVSPAIVGDPGTCRYGVFDGPNSGYVQINDPGTGSILDLPTALSVSVWVYPHSYPSSGLSTIVSKDENFEFHLNTSGRVNWWWGGGSNELTSTGVVALNTWTHITIVYANGSQQIYLNGVLAGSHNDTGTLTQNNDPVLIGTDLGFNSRTFDGFIDEVRIFDSSLNSSQVGLVYNETHPCDIGPDHYAISHSSPTVTCEPASVVVTPHDSSHNAVSADGKTITLTTSVANDGWALISGSGSLVGNQYTYAGGETSVELGLVKTTPATLNIDITDGTATENSGGSEDENLVFVDTAFKFFSDDVVDAIGTQISAKSSDQAPGAATLTIRAIHSDPATGRCEALLTGLPENIGLAYECNNPSNCALTNHLTLNGVDLDGSNSGGTLSYTNVPLNFLSNGTASFTMAYADAGQISLHAQADLTVGSSSVTVSGSSNDFVVRPAGLCVVSSDPNASCSAPYQDCSVIRPAGEPFPLTISARAWATAGQADTQFCSNAITPNFTFSSIPLSHDLVAPTPGSDGSISLGGATIATGGTVTVSQSVSEVGAFTFSAGVIDDYLGATDADIALSTSATIGRFVPAQFSIQNPQLTEANGSFSYLMQPFDVSFDIQAENLFGGVTSNYKDVFAKIDNDASHLSYDALLDAVPVLFDETRIAASATVINWADGVGDTTAQLQIQRTALLEAPLTNLTVGVRVDETEGSYDLETSNIDLDTDLSASLEPTLDHVELGVTSQRFARLYATDVWGPESAGLSVPLQVQYWNGSIWILSAGDETQIPRTDITFIDSGGAGAFMTTDPVTAPVGSDPAVSFSYDPTGNATLAFGDGLGGGNGDSGMFVGAPGAQGFFRVDVDLTNFPWLQFDWDQDGNYNDADDFDLPRFTVTFESYRGHDRIIYWREVLSPL